MDSNKLGAHTAASFCLLLARTYYNVLGCMSTKTNLNIPQTTMYNRIIPHAEPIKLFTFEAACNTYNTAIAEYLHEMLILPRNASNSPNTS